jgi:hypothetical protein
MVLQVEAVAMQKALKTAEMVLLTKKFIIIAETLIRKTTTIMDMLMDACQ